MKRILSNLCLLWVFAVALVACSSGGGSGTNPFAANGETESNTKGSNTNPFHFGSQSVPNSESGNTWGGTGNIFGNTPTAVFLPGATSGHLDYQKHFVCPLEDSGVNFIGDCKVYSNGTTSSVVFSGSASDGIDWMGMSFSLVADFDNRKAKMRMDVNVKGPNIVDYEEEIEEEIREGMCQETMAGFLIENKTCGTNYAEISSPMENGASQEFFVEHSKGYCESVCDYF